MSSHVNGKKCNCTKAEEINRIGMINSKKSAHLKDIGFNVKIKTETVIINYLLLRLFY